MLGFNRDHKVIQVQLIEVGSTKPFAQSAVPVEQLPDSFEIATNLNIAQVDWRVDHAVPANKSQFRKTGTLSVYLYKAKTVTVSPSEILFSLATINDELPKLVNASLEDVLVMHEDDWRQVELVSKAFSLLIQEEFGDIREIYLNHRLGSAFKNMHIRKRIPAPLSGITLSLAELYQLFGVTHAYKGVAFSSTAAIVEHGFAFPISEQSLLWGKITEQGLISALCVKGGPELQSSPEMIDLLNRHDLLFVDWHHPTG